MDRERSLEKGMFQILFANILNVIFSLGTNILLPKFLSLDTYAQIKSYQLYIGYVAILHFGYNDGMYLRFGGKSKGDICSGDIQRNISTLKLFQIVITVCCVVFALLLNNIALLMAALAILPQNMVACFKNLYQAIGEFKNYSRIMNLTTGLTFTINLFLISVVRIDECVFYLAAYVMISVILWGLLEYSLYKDMGVKPTKFSFFFLEFQKNISSGILLLLGNMSSQLLTGMDRWFVKGLMNTVAFAQYSFAVSMENFLNVAVTPITLTMYNFFCINDDEEKIRNIRELVILFATVIVSAAFPIKFIVGNFLPKYIDTTAVVFLLFTAQIFYIIIKSIYVNLYKARKMQKLYFIKLCSVVLTGFAFNVICYSLFHTKESFAIGTLFSALVWFFLCQFDFKQLKYSPRHLIYISLEVLTFLGCGLLMHSVAGCLLYILVTLILAKLLLPNASTCVWNICKTLLKKQ